MIYRTIKSSPLNQSVVTLVDMKAFLRVDDDEEDDLISALAVAATAYVETATNRALLQQEYQLFLDQFPCGGYFYLPNPPLSSVTSITYRDYNDATQTMSSNDYGVDQGSGTDSRVYLKSGAAWPSDVVNELDAVKVTYVAGYGVASTVPGGLKVAVKQLVAHWFENREGVVLGVTPSEVPFAVQALINQNKLMTVPYAV